MATHDRRAIPEERSADDRGRKWLTRGVASVGLASFFSDSGHEIATSLLPSFLRETLRASPGALGLIEGVSDGIAGIAKLVGGAGSNDERRRRGLATGGYLVTAAATGALGAATSILQAGVLRTVAWSARGARTPARDAMLASLVSPDAYGRAYGYERALDHLGAVVGPLAAAGLVTSIGIRPAIYLSAVPGTLAALAIVAAAAEARRLHDPVRRRFGLELGPLRGAGLARPLVPIMVFELGNCATTLLILRAIGLLGHGRSVTAATSIAVLLYAGHNLLGSLIAYPGGRWLDRTGPRAVFGTGALLFGLAYVSFALPLPGWPLVLVAFMLAGAGMGLVETAEPVLVARLLPDHLRGGGFGVLGGIQSLGDFASSAAVGLIWATVSAAAAFAYATVWMPAALVLSGLIGARRA